MLTVAFQLHKLQDTSVILVTYIFSGIRKFSTILNHALFDNKNDIRLKSNQVLLLNQLKSNINNIEHGFIQAILMFSRWHKKLSHIIEF